MRKCGMAIILGSILVSGLFSAACAEELPAPTETAYEFECDTQEYICGGLCYITVPEAWGTIDNDTAQAQIDDYNEAQLVKNKTLLFEVNDGAGMMTMTAVSGYEYMSATTLSEYYDSLMGAEFDDEGYSMLSNEVVSLNGNEYCRVTMTETDDDYSNIIEYDVICFDDCMIMCMYVESDIAEIDEETRKMLDCALASVKDFV